MAVAHGLAVQVVEKRQHGGHVLDDIPQPAVQNPAPDSLVHVLHLILDLAHGPHQGLGVDLVPQDRVPVLEGGEHQHDAVPEVLQEHELLLALPELAVVGHLHVEEQLQIVEFLGALLDIDDLRVVLVHHGVAHVELLAQRVLAVEGALVPEVRAERAELLSEDVDLVADLEHLLALQRQDLLLLVEGHADDLVPLRRRLLQLDQPLVHHVVLLEQLAQVPDRCEQHLERGRRELHVADVCHGRVEELLVVRLVHRRRRAEPSLLVVDEVHEGLDPGLRVGLDVVRVLFLPVAGEGHQSNLDGLNVDP
mmetsp:Transcript_33252/g.87958  ORF Transcript_33252/g.87958 Transcript_33252/m.87958 type:complete len:308 (-) Transcript_33252:3335-4258(-)